MEGKNISGRLKALDGDLKSTLFLKSVTDESLPGRRNEDIDCLAYNVAAMTVLSIKNWDLSEKSQIEARQKREKSDYFK